MSKHKPHTTVAQDGAVWRWSCRYCECSDTRWRHGEAVQEARDHLARHREFGFRRKT